MTLVIAIVAYIALAITIGKLLAYASRADGSELAERRLAAVLNESDPLLESTSPDIADDNRTPEELAPSVSTGDKSRELETTCQQ